MTENYKFSGLDQKCAQTADDFYPASRTQEYKNSNVNLLQVNLNSQRTKLRSCEYEHAALKDKLNDMDLKVDKLTIANEFLSGEADSIAAKNAELLNHKGVILEEIKDWKDASETLEEEANKCSNEIIEWKRKVIVLEECEQELKEKIRVQNELNEKVQDYSMNMEGHIQEASNELAQARLNRDGLVQNMTTLQTFAKSFKKNIVEKGKELSRCQYETSELENLMTTKNFEKANFQKEREQAQWECKMYVHHNTEIEKTNSKLKFDLEKLMKHLESLKKANKHLGGCLKDYSETGVAAAKKILLQSNK